MTTPTLHDGQTVTLTGRVWPYTVSLNATGAPWVERAVLDCGDRRVTFKVFPAWWPLCRDLLVAGQQVTISGRVDAYSGEPVVMVREVSGV